MDGDFVPDCDLSNPLANNGGDPCAQISDLGFGTERFTSDLDPKLVSGWGVRPGDWQIGASVQQQLLPRVSAEFGYTRRWLTNFTWDNNVLQATNQFDTFSVTAPNDSASAGRGARPDDQWSLQRPAERGVAGQQRHHAGQRCWRRLHADPQRLPAQRQRADAERPDLPGRYRHGRDGIRLLRRPRGLAGIHRAGPQNPTNPWCNTSTGWVTRAHGSRLLHHAQDRRARSRGRSAATRVRRSPRTWSSRQGRRPSAAPFANAAPNVTVNLVEPGTLYGDRVNEIDMRFAKILRFGRTRTNVGFDIYNIMNANPILTYNQAFNPTINANPSANWLAPQSTLQPRFVKFSAQIDF